MTNLGIALVSDLRAITIRLTGNHMKLKINDRVVFQHIAAGTRKQTGTVIEVEKAGRSQIYAVKSDRDTRIYPCLTLSPQFIGIIYKRIS